jgi:hypothetical protein
MVRDMAVAAWQVGEQSRLQVEHLEMQIARASSIFDAKELEKFEELQAKWMADPAAHAQAMANSYLGVKHFAHIWKGMVESLGPDGVGLSLKMTCQAVAAEGISPRPDEIFGPGDWLMKRFLATTASPTDSVHEWLDRFGARKSKITHDRAERLYFSAPDAGISHKELHERAQEKFQYWDNLMQKRRKEYDLAKMQFTQANAGNGMGDKEMETQVRLMHRYRTAAQNRMDKLDRQLKASKAERARKEHKIRMREERENNRKTRTNLQIARFSDRQYRQYIELVASEERREFQPSQDINHQTDDDHEMKIQSLPSSIDQLEKIMAEGPRPEMQISIVPPTDPEATDEELEALIDECFTKKPHEGMFSGWPTRLLTKDSIITVGLMLIDRGKNESQAKEIQLCLMREYGRRLISEHLTRKAEAEHEALVKDATGRQARRKLKFDRRG